MCPRKRPEFAGQHIIAAELYSALDLVSLTLTEVLEGPSTACALADKFEAGKLALEADLVIDAASVFDHTATAEPRAPTTRCDNDNPLLETA